MGMLDALFRPARPKPTASPPPPPQGNPGSHTRPAVSSPSDTTRIVVLLDGDADYFDASYLTVHGGGRMAALVLHQHVLAWNLQRGGSDTDLQVLVQLCWNRKGLEGHLRTQGIPTNLSAFAASFNSSPFAFSIIDTGSTKEAADKSLQNLMRFHISHCDALILGGAHDQGYTDILHQLNPRLRQKVTLLRSSLVTQHTAALMLPIITFPGMFFSSNRSVATTRPPTGPSVEPQVVAPFPPKMQNGSVPSRVGTAVTKTTVPVAAASQAIKVVPKVVERTHVPTQSFKHAAKTVAPVAAVQVASKVVRSAPITVHSSTHVVAQAHSEPHDFNPLIEILLALRGQGNLQPRRSLVGNHINDHKCGFSYSRVYALAAEEAKIVKLGGVSSFAWIELIGEHVASPRVVSNITKFEPLLMVIRQQQTLGFDHPLRAVISVALEREHPKLKFKTIAAEAAEAGLVVMGLGEKEGSETITLSSTSKGTTPVAFLGMDQGSVHPSRDVPVESASKDAQSKDANLDITMANLANFEPLLAVLRIQRSKGSHDPLRSLIGGLLKSQDQLLYQNFGTYVAKAQRAGVVSLGRGPTLGADTISLTAV